MEKLDKEADCLEPGIIFIPYVFVPYRGKFFYWVNGVLLRILPKTLKIRYVSWLQDKPIKAIWVGKRPHKYSQKINASYYHNSDPSKG